MRYLLMVVLLSLCSHCLATPMGGVIANERIVRLPEDGTKFYISIIGDKADARYTEVLGWFENVPKLKALKGQVHFIPVTTDTAIYTERYEKSLKSVPSVRVQSNDGTVLYEACGNKLPMSGESLYNAIATGVNGGEEWLPWRRKNHQPDPIVPTPVVTPDTDPAPQPLDDGEIPVFEPVDNLPVALIAGCVVALIVGLVAGQIEKSKKIRKIGKS